MSARGLKISRILHAGYVFEYDQTQIAFDPIFENPFSRNCYAFPNVKFDHEQIRSIKLAAVFISHFHDDHCSVESLDFLDRTTPIYVYCIFEEMLELIRALGFTQVYSLTLNSSVHIGSFEVVTLPALDRDVDSIFHIKAAGLNVLNVVDSWIDPLTLKQIIQCGPWDMVLWPFQTMREIEVLAPSRAAAAVPELPKEWLEQLKALNPRFLVPSSCQFVQEEWSWYNQALFPISYRQFETELKALLPKATVCRLNPSVSVLLKKTALEKAAPLAWVQPIGNQDVDYEYRGHAVRPTTADIARKLAGISEEQTKKVFDYCRNGIFEKHNRLEPTQDIYFSRPRIWRLRIYDPRGKETDFYYKITNGFLESNSDNESISWSTEIPSCKLYAALELGESLTSMYIRINDVTFDPEIEAEIQDVDVIEDPLIRCLFTDTFGSYQKAQLNRLSENKLLESQNETRQGRQ